MMCEAMWMLASFQSTNVPFIQILPVPGNAITAPFRDRNPDFRRSPNVRGTRGLVGGWFQAWSGPRIADGRQRHWSCHLTVRYKPNSCSRCHSDIFIVVVGSI